MEISNSYEPPELRDYPLLILGSTPLEKLCIAIINAHPEKDRDAKRTARDRLKAAVSALAGFDPTKGENETDDDRWLRNMSELLGHEAHQHAAKKKRLGVWEQVTERGRVMAELASDSKSCRALAKRALERAGMPVTEADKKRLARKFAHRWRGVHQEGGLAMPPPKFEDECLARIIRLLDQIGIPAIMPDDPGAFWELSIAK